MSPQWFRLMVAALLSVALFACGDDEGPAGNNESIGITVFAASSLTGAFEEMGPIFEDEQPGTDLTFNFLASSDLAAQIEQGSPAHVFASADETNMQRVVDAKLARGQPQVFAHNKLEVIVPPDNPGGVTQLGDLTDPKLVVSLCNEECPAGRYALEVFDNAGIDVEADSLETEVKAVVTRVSLGEADAGVAYATDTKAANGDVEGVPIPDDVNVLATYPIVRIVDSPGQAGEFVDFVLSDEGQEILAEYGFLAP